ncbi:MAG: hypothetical protein HY060_14475 [Proteobacteria bacterium]|nr:hypothetical protein [Pseudomonadota bacterium]
MLFSYFAIFYGAAPLADADRARAIEVVRTTPRLVKAHVYTQEQTRDPYLDDGPPPPLALQLYFADIADLEAALAERGHLQALAAQGALPSLAGTRVEQQAMLARPFPVPDAGFRTPAGALPCTYLVYYPGTADDLNHWLAYYIAHHPPLMARFPGIREIEICTRVDWCGFLPWRRIDHMQRNKVVFDSAAALTAALNSPVRHEMRADFHKFPPFQGGSLHHPMATLTLTP